jgi:hypothetical protein
MKDKIINQLYKLQKSTALSKKDIALINQIIGSITYKL